jgi:hypothetical protein
VITVIRVVPSFEGFVPPKDLDESEKRLPVDFELENRNWDELDKNVEELLRTIQRRSPSNH